MNKTGVSPGVIETRRNQHSLLRSILIVLVYLTSFILLDFITEQFEVSPGIVTWYPPAGLTYALLLVFGVRFTPAVTIALFLSSVFIYRMPQPPYLLLLWSLVISLTYAAAAWFLRHRIHLDWQLRKLRDVAWLVLTAVLASAFLAVLSVSSSALSSALPRGEVLRAIFHWWIGEAVGVLTVTPFLLVYVMPWLKRFVDVQPVSLPKHFSFPSPALTFIAQTLSIVLILYWVFGVQDMNEFRPMYLMTLPLIWIAIEHGFKRLTVAIMVLNFGVVFALWFFRFDLARLGELQLIMIIICVVGLLTGAVVTERKRAEEKLEEERILLRTLIDNLPDAIFVKDVLGRKLISNLADWQACGGKNMQDVIGKTDFETYPLEVANEYWANDKEVLETGLAILDREELGLDSQRKLVTRSSSKLPLRDGNGNIIGLVGISHDITERKHAEQTLHLKIDELELFHSLTVGRELKMIELKKEINALLKQAGKLEEFQILDEEQT